ncbi:MAG: hypothetical protein IT289_05865 [Oligoflexia bacterium]|nr:hypothetical protein [Oligoflexia bacterium]
MKTSIVSYGLAMALGIGLFSTAVEAKRAKPSEFQFKLKAHLTKKEKIRVIQAYRQFLIDIDRLTVPNQSVGLQIRLFSEAKADEIIGSSCLFAGWPSIIVKISESRVVCRAPWLIRANGNPDLAKLSEEGKKARCESPSEIKCQPLFFGEAAGCVPFNGSGEKTATELCSERDPNYDETLKAWTKESQLQVLDSVERFCNFDYSKYKRFNEDKQRTCSALKARLEGLLDKVEPPSSEAPRAEAPADDKASSVTPEGVTNSESSVGVFKNGCHFTSRYGDLSLKRNKKNLEITNRGKKYKQKLLLDASSNWSTETCVGKVNWVKDDQCTPPVPVYKRAPLGSCALNFPCDQDKCPSIKTEVRGNELLIIIAERNGRNLEYRTLPVHRELAEDPDQVLDIPVCGKKGPLHISYNPKNCTIESPYSAASTGEDDASEKASGVAR